MKASRLIFTLLLASSVAVVQLAAQQTKADQKPIGEVKAKAEAGDAESQVELGFRYEHGEGVREGSGGGGEVVSQSRRAKLRRSAKWLSASATKRAKAWPRNQVGSGEVVSQSRRAESTPRLNTVWASATVMAKAWRRIRWRR